MKTKTQIKRKAKRMISLLLTAMLVISTMAVGLSVVNAATTDDAVNAGESKTFYLFYSDNDNISSWSEDNKIKMELVNDKYVAQLNLKYQDNGVNQYFAINDSPNKPTSNSQLWNATNQYSINSTASNISDKAPQEHDQIYFFRFAYYKLNSVTIEFDVEFFE